MEQSTPIYNKAKGRRRTLMRVEDTPITSESVNDEFERTSRRSIIEIKKKAQGVQSPALNESVRFSGEQEMKDHLQICTKLYAENKITTGIAWQLHIIDLLGVMSKKQSTNTLQVASTSLDIGAKVYGLRVDDLHAEGLKLANSMARFAEKNQVQEKGEEHESNDEECNNEDQSAKKKKKKLRSNRGVKNTIVKDRNTLLGEIPQLESVFFSNRIDSNLSTVDNLFTNSLPMDKSCYKLLALGEEKAWVTGPDEAVVGLEGSKSFDVDLLPKEGNICVPFQNFILNQYNPEEDEQSNADKLLDDVVVYDNEGFPVAELDGSIHDMFNDNNCDQDNEDEPITEDILAHQIQHDVPRVVDLITSQVELKRSEYSYNSVITLANGKVIDQIWAGPSHWKLKFIRRDKSMFSGRIDEEAHQAIARPKKKLKKREPQPIDFLETDYAALKQSLENMKKIKIKKRIFPANKITLPLADASCRDMIRNMHELMIKPGTICMPKSDTTVPLENTRDDYNINQMETDNNDVYDDGPNHMDHDPDNDVEEEEVVINREQNFMGDNLVDAPESVAKVYIPYALQAKKMDMKKLKGYTWQLLTQNLPEHSKKVNPTTFSNLFQNLPNVLPQAMRKELTCSLAFSALLHLCNEENLKLTQMPGFKDFKIESG